MRRLLSGLLLGAILFVVSCGDTIGLPVFHAGPAHETLTRVAFLDLRANGQSQLFFSTLESNADLVAERGFFLVSHATESQVTRTLWVAGSAEARSVAFDSGSSSYVLGASLPARIFRFDAAADSLIELYSAPKQTAWVHGLSVHGDYAYFMLSTPVADKQSRGIRRVDLLTGKTDVLIINDDLTQGFGAVQTVDPTGRVWFYRAYPLSLQWYDRGVNQPRRLVGYEGWSIESWDDIDGRQFLILSDSAGSVQKVQVNLRDLTPFPTTLPKTDDVLLRVVPVDLHHSGVPALAGLYVDPSDNRFFRTTGLGRSLRFLGQANLGRLEVMSAHGTPQESAIRWMHPALGELRVLGMLPNGSLAVWVAGGKTLVFADLVSGVLSTTAIKVENLSPADVTALAKGADGLLYGGAYLTWTDIFSLDPESGTARVLSGAVPRLEGQVNMLIAGSDGYLYGAAHPGSVPFRFDPRATWNPGASVASNPRNLGTLRNRQERAFHGVQAGEGTFWYQSVSDYHERRIYALVKADFVKGRVDVRTDQENGFPSVFDLTVFDSTHLLLLGIKGRAPGLYSLDRRTFSIAKMAPLQSADGRLIRIGIPTFPYHRILLIQNNRVAIVDNDLSLSFVHRTLSSVLAAVPDDNAVMLIGRHFVERLTFPGPKTSLWWRSTLSRTFTDTAWTPAEVVDGVLFLANEQRVHCLTAPTESRVSTNRTAITGGQARCFPTARNAHVNPTGTAR